MVPAMPLTVDRLRSVLLRLLDDGALSTETLQARVEAETGQKIDEDAIGDVLDGVSDAWPVDDDHFANPQTAFEGWTLTHLVTEEEAASATIAAFPDFALMFNLAADRGESLDYARYRFGLSLKTAEPGAEVPVAGVPTVAEIDAAFRPKLRHPTADLVWETPDSDLYAAEDLETTVRGPAGWLTGCSGNLVGFERRGDEWRWVGVVTDPPVDDLNPVEQAMVGALTALLDDAEISTLVHSLASRLVEQLPTETEPGRFPEGVLRPTGDLLATAGLTRHGDLIARNGYDWAGFESRRVTSQLASRWGVPFETANAFGMMMGASVAWETLADRGEDMGEMMQERERSTFLKALGAPGCAELVAANQRAGSVHAEDASLLALLTDLRRHASGPVGARIDWLRSRLEPDPTVAAACLDAAERGDRRFLPAIDDRLWETACRGDRAGFDDAFRRWIDAGAVSPKVIAGDVEPGPAALLRFGVLNAMGVRPARRNVEAGRNDPCPCGSGQKYKRCHLGKPIPRSDGDASADAPFGDLRQRVPGLQALQLMHLDRRDPRTISRLVARLNAAIGESDPNLVTLFALDAATADAAETEHFLAAAAQAGARWSDDEVALVRRWAECRHSVFEVTDRVPGRQLSVRDLRTGSLFNVRAIETSRGFGIDDLILARVVPDGVGFQFAQGALGVPRPDRDATLAFIDGCDAGPTPLDLADWIAGLRGRFAGGRRRGEIRNTDNDTMVLFRSRYVVPGPGLFEDTCRIFDTVALLTRRDETGEPEVAWIWDAIRPDDPNRTLRGSVTAYPVEGEPTVLDVVTNSITRRNEIRAALEAGFGALTLLDETVDDQEDEQLGHSLGLATGGFGFAPSSGAGPDGTGELSPETVDQINRELERRWLETSIPGLGGLTPRQAADDPTRRGDLRLMLQSFVADATPDGMFAADPKRLADELGIELPRTLPRLR